MQARLGGSPEFGGAAPRDHSLEDSGLDDGRGEEPVRFPAVRVRDGNG